jgi:hypothetical protein
MFHTFTWWRKQGQLSKRLYFSNQK